MKKPLLAGFALAATVAHAQHPEPVAYPSQGQSAEQQSRDRDECRDWARNESGYTSVHRATLPRQLPVPRELAQAAPVGPNEVTYLRAMAACMEERGYTVR